MKSYFFWTIVATILSLNNVHALEIRTDFNGPFLADYNYVVEYQCIKHGKRNLFKKAVGVFGSLLNKEVDYLGFAFHDGKNLAFGDNPNENLNNNLFSTIISAKQKNKSLVTFENNCSGYFFIDPTLKLHVSVFESRRNLTDVDLAKIVGGVVNAGTSLYFIATGNTFGVTDNKRIQSAQTLAREVTKVIVSLNPPKANTRTAPLKPGRVTARSRFFDIVFDVRALRNGMIDDKSTQFSIAYNKILKEENTPKIDTTQNIVVQCRELRRSLYRGGLKHSSDRAYAAFAILHYNNVARKDIVRCLKPNRRLVDSYHAQKRIYQNRFGFENYIPPNEFEAVDNSEKRIADIDAQRNSAKALLQQFKKKKYFRFLSQALLYYDNENPEIDRNRLYIDNLRKIFTDPIEIVDDTPDFLIMLEDPSTSISLSDLIGKILHAGYSAAGCHVISIDKPIFDTDEDDTDSMFVLAKRTQEDSRAVRENALGVRLSTSDGKIQKVIFTDRYVDSVIREARPCRIPEN